MISEIRMEKVASFKGPTSLSTKKKVNLIYGLNGTGKTTISDFLYEPAKPRFGSCKLVPKEPGRIFVYNRRFIEDHFFVADGLKGIFSLSKENKEAKEKIAKAESAINELQGKRKSQIEKKQEIQREAERQEKQAFEEVWKIKHEYAGGDRVLEYCLEGLMGDKKRMFSHLVSVDLPEREPPRTTAQIREDVEVLKAEDADVQPELPRMKFTGHDVETAAIFSKAILGSKDSEVAAHIEELGNADWVREGLAFVLEPTDEDKDPCPFCQERTITEALLGKLNEYFDEVYERNLETLRAFQQKYAAACDSIADLEAYTAHPMIGNSKFTIAERHKNLTNIMKDNQGIIKRKLAQPSTPQQLFDTNQAVSALNEAIESANQAIKEYNKRITKRDSALASLKREFWQVMRWNYDQTISRYERDTSVAAEKVSSIDRELEALEDQLRLEREKIARAQKETVNTQEAVDAINAGLLDLGISDFCIARHSESSYRIVRSGESDDVFKTLSEGEKMIISFLYFCELCKGKGRPEEVDSERIVVIDDPISSLSHVFVFNVGQLIKARFLSSPQFSQVFVLTHSLYFFYELTDRNHQRRKESQELFRISKPLAGSKVSPMKYKEIQNDYQAYWSIINDPDESPALIANCMRSIIEYFFGFVRARDLNNVFNLPELQEPRFQAFCRFVDRESHSDAQNIMDMKEFDYDTFREGLRLVFSETGYPEHYDEMSKH